MGKYYVVWNGHKPGIYDNLTQAQKQVKGYSNGRWKSFLSRSEAEKAYGNPPKSYPKKGKSVKQPKIRKVHVEALATDKQLAFIESLRSQLGEMVYERATKKIDVDGDNLSIIEASEMIEYLLEIRDTPKMKIEIQESYHPPAYTNSGLFPAMDILLAKVVTELRIYRMEHPK